MLIDLMRERAGEPAAEGARPHQTLRRMNRIKEANLKSNIVAPKVKAARAVKLSGRVSRVTDGA